MDHIENQFTDAIEAAGLSFRDGMQLLTDFRRMREDGFVAKAAPRRESTSEAKPAKAKKHGIGRAPVIRTCPACSQEKAAQAFKGDTCKACLKAAGAAKPMKREKNAGFALQAKDAAPALRKCLYCDEKKSKAEFHNGQECKACHEKR